MKILVRADASVSIGVGHVTRSRNLARELKRRGADVTFVHRYQTGDLSGALAKEFDTRLLPEIRPEEIREHKASRNDTNSSEISQRRDAEDMAKIMEEIEPVWTIVDHYGLGVEWESTIKQYGSKIIVIDDLALRRHDCDYLIDQNWHGKNTQTRYAGLVSSETTLKLGPRYALLDKEYAERRSLKTRHQGRLSRILVCFGGSDMTNQTCKTLQALDCKDLHHLDVDVVVNKDHEFMEDIVAKVEKLANCTLYCSPPTIAKFIENADLAIGAGGSTTWERCCLGLPTIAITTASNQEQHCSILEADNSIIFLGHSDGVTAEDLRSSIRDIKYDTEKLSELSDNCKKYTDGHGVKRIASIILGPEEPLSLRDSTLIDEDILWYWVNEPTVRRNSLSKKVVTLNEHKRWYQKQLASKYCSIFVAEMADGLPVGQVRFDWDMTRGSAILSYSIDKDFRGLGLGKEMVRAGVKAIRSLWGPAPIYAEVSKDNRASRAIMKSTGFKEVEPLRRTADCFVFRGDTHNPHLFDT